MDRQREMNTTLNSVSIEELAPGTVYIIQVCATIGFTKGPFATIEVSTDAEISMPGPPLDFRVEFVLESVGSSPSISVLKLKWKRPLTNSDNIAFYRLYYQHLHYGPLNSQDQNSDSKSSTEDENGDANEYQDEESLLSDSSAQSDENSTLSTEKYQDIEVLSSETAEDRYEYLLYDLVKYSAYKLKLVAIDKLASTTVT